MKVTDKGQEDENMGNETRSGVNICYEYRTYFLYVFFFLSPNRPFHNFFPFIATAKPSLILINEKKVLPSIC